MQTELEYLVENQRYLSEPDRAKLKMLMLSEIRGFRTNPLIEQIAPVVHPKQASFLALESIEAMFGGAAGGGKSFSLLLSALQYVDQPGYSAIIFRKTFTDLAGQGAIMDVAQRLLAPTYARWSAGEKSFFFDTGPNSAPARLSFGYLDNEGDRYRYQGLEFQGVFFDELTQHPIENYTYLFSRLRRLESCEIPLRMRSATNPGGKFGEWVKDRFIPPEYLLASEEEQFTRHWAKSEPCAECMETGRMLFDGQQIECFYCDGRGVSLRDFIPSRLQDNPSLDRRAYLKSLAELGPVERYRLEHGRWDVSDSGGIFRQAWFRYYRFRGEHIIAHYIDANGTASDVVMPNESLRYFITVDSASKEKTSADFSVIMLWAYDVKHYNLFLVNCHRERMDVPKLAPAVMAMASSCGHPIECIIIEDASSGIGLIQGLRQTAGRGSTVKPFSPGSRDLVGNSVIAQIRMEAGQIFLPAGSPGWLAPVVEEWLAFPAGAHDDTVSATNQAANHVGHLHNQRKSLAAAPTQISAGISGQIGYGHQPRF